MHVYFHQIDDNANCIDELVTDAAVSTTQVVTTHDHAVSSILHAVYDAVEVNTNILNLEYNTNQSDVNNMHQAELMNPPQKTNSSSEFSPTNGQLNVAHFALVEEVYGGHPFG